MALKDYDFSEITIKILTDVRFWIALLFIIRLENIDLAPLDRHFWRQSITLGVARNYLEWDANFFHPRTVLCDSRGGIQAQEFPIFNYLIFLMWKIFGTHDWCYRLLNLITTSIGLFYFYRIVKNLVNDKVALMSTIFFGSSIAFIYGRMAMPDVFAVSFALIGVSFGWDFLKEGKSKNLILFGLFATLGILSKIPATCVLALLAAPFFDKENDIGRKKKLAAVGFFALTMLVLWYFVWVPWAEETYKNPLYFPVSLSVGWQETMVECLTDTIGRFRFMAFQQEWTFWVAMIGLILIVVKWNKRLLLPFVLYASLMFFFILKAGRIFSGHEYYVIPFIPMMAILAGYAIDSVWKNQVLQLIPIVFLTVLSLYPQKEYFFIPNHLKKFLKLEAITDSVVPKKARVICTTGTGQPWMLYAAHRRGWTDENRIKDADWVRSEAPVGMAYAIVDKEKLRDSLPFPVLFDDNDFRIYKTKPDSVMLLPRNYDE